MKKLANQIQKVIQKRDSNTFHALNYGIDQNDCPTLSAVKQQLTTLKAYTTRIKTFTLTGCDEGIYCDKLFTNVTALILKPFNS